MIFLKILKYNNKIDIGMSELQYAFRNTNNAPFISKRLYSEERQDNRRGDPPQKLFSKRSEEKVNRFDGANLVKKHLSKIQLKK